MGRQGRSDVRKSTYDFGNPIAFFLYEVKRIHGSHSEHSRYCTNGIVATIRKEAVSREGFFSHSVLQSTQEKLACLSLKCC
jgi:hypothetical protein